MTDRAEITAMLAAARGGDRTALDQVFARVYGEIRRIAHGQIARAGGGVSLDTTAVVHEAYLKLVRSPAISWEDRGHFFAVAAMAMRQILLNHARARRAKKRGGGDVVAWQSGHAEPGVDPHIERFVELDAALTRLKAIDERMAKVVDLRFFAGLSVEETAEALGVTDRTVKRDWRAARAFLHRELGNEAA
jgi:RNA polymerase sigma factor (TIGR02999 family)